MTILDERKPSKATSGRKKRVFLIAFFGRGRIFVNLTKKKDETGSPDENLNTVFRTSRGQPDPSPPPGSGRSPSERACLIADRLGQVKGPAASAARSG